MFNVKQLINVGKIFLKQNKPTIEFVAGAGLVVAGTAFLIKDAQKIADANADLSATINEAKEINKLVKEENTTWTDETGKSKSSYIIHATVHHSLAYAKVLGKGVGCEIVGLGLMSLAHVDLTRQIQTISAAAAAQAISFANYRQRVREDAGELKDYQYLTGNVKKTVTIKDDGTVVEETTPVSPIDKGMSGTPHSFWLSDTGLYTGNNLRDWAALERHLHIVNDVLHYNKMLTLNEIFEIFQAPKTVVGQCAGAWAQDKNGSLNYIDIGLTSGPALNFKNGVESDILITITYVGGKPLESNVLSDSRIHDIMGWKSR